MHRSNSIVAATINTLDCSLGARMGKVPIIICGPIACTTHSFIRTRITLGPGCTNITMCSPSKGHIPTRIVDHGKSLTHVVFTTSMPSIKCTICSIHPTGSNLGTGSLHTKRHALRGEMCGLALSTGNSVTSVQSGHFGHRLITRKGTFHLTMFRNGGSCR